MGARRRALVVMAILAVACVASSLVLIHSSDLLAADSSQIQVEGARATQLQMFRDQVLVWAAGGFTPDEIDQVMASDKVAGIAAVRGGLIGVQSPGTRAGYRVIPVEVMAVDPVAYASAAGRAGDGLRRALQHGVVLSQTSASLRRLGVGGKLRVTGGTTLTVSGIIDDQLLAGYEAAVSRPLAGRLGLTHASYLLLRPRGSVTGLEAAVQSLLHRRTLRFVLPGQRSWFRSGETLPLEQVKARFGELSVQSLHNPVPGPAWVAANLVTRNVPVLGQVHCHRAIIADLNAAMAELQRLQLDRFIDLAAVGEHGGCMDPRHPVTISPSTGLPLPLSHAEWGIDLELGTTPKVDQRLVQVMAKHGFSWGGHWLPAAPDRFEWVGAGA
jgi:hypothetical protein